MKKIGVAIFSILFMITCSKPNDTQNQIVDTPEKSVINETPNQFELPSGIKITILKYGSGKVTKSGDRVTVHYTGWLDNGTQFDSSFDFGSPFTFTIGRGEVIQGWDLGVLGMKPGEKRKLIIPPVLGYGDEGVPDSIPPNAQLIFEISLLKIEH